MADLVLGSGSPRRAELLGQLGLRFRVLTADIDETPAPGEHPDDYVRRMAREKAAALADLTTGEAVLTADTTVVIDGESLGKPEDADHARSLLERLSGRRHQVATAIWLRRGDRERDTVVTTEVEFAGLTPALIDAYLATDEPWDKAGAYGIQGLAGSFVRRIEGSVSNVIGLPLVETRELLACFGIEASVGAGGPSAAVAAP